MLFFVHNSRIPVLIGAAWAVVIAVCGCTLSPLEAYVPRNPEEEQILSLLIAYQDARSRFDVERFLGCLHDKGTYHHASRVMLSKKELSEALPGFWAQLQKGERSFYPMCRENLSGNYFVRFRLFDPTIKVVGNTATVTVIYSNAHWRLHHYISLVKEGDTWLIWRLDWETG